MREYDEYRENPHGFDPYTGRFRDDNGRFINEFVYYDLYGTEEDEEEDESDEEDEQAQDELDEPEWWDDSMPPEWRDDYWDDDVEVYEFEIGIDYEP